MPVDGAKGSLSRPPRRSGFWAEAVAGLETVVVVVVVAAGGGAGEAGLGTLVEEEGGWTENVAAVPADLYKKYNNSSHLAPVNTPGITIYMYICTCSIRYHCL